MLEYSMLYYLKWSCYIYIIYNHIPNCKNVLFHITDPWSHFYKWVIHLKKIILMLAVFHLYCPNTCIYSCQHFAVFSALPNNFDPKNQQAVILAVWSRCSSQKLMWSQQSLESLIIPICHHSFTWEHFVFQKGL